MTGRFLSGRESRRQGTEIGDLDLRARLPEENYENEYEDLLRSREEQKSRTGTAAEERNDSPKMIPDDAGLPNAGFPEDDLYDDDFEDIDDSPAFVPAVEPKEQPESRKAEPVLEEEIHSEGDVAPGAGSVPGCGELFSPRRRLIKIARFDRIYFDGRPAPAEMNGMFGSEDELCAFIGGMPGNMNGPVKTGYYMGYRYRAIFPPVAVSGVTVSFAGFPQSGDVSEAELTGFGVMSEEMLAFLKDKLSSGTDLIIAGKKESGTEMMLSVLGKFSGSGEGLCVSIGMDPVKVKNREVLREIPSEECSEDCLIADALEQKAETLILKEISASNILPFLDITESRKIQCLAGIFLEEDREMLLVKRLSELSRLSPKKVAKKITGEPEILYVYMEKDADGVDRAARTAILRKEEQEGKVYAKLQSLFRYDSERGIFIKEESV